MDINRDIGTSKFTWTDVVTGVTSYRTDLARGSAVQVAYSNQEVAWKDGTISLAASSANTAQNSTVTIFASAGGGACVGLFAKVGNSTAGQVVSTLALWPI